MKSYKEFLYGFGIFVLHVLFGVVSGQFLIFFTSGFILASLVSYVLCKLRLDIKPIGVDYNLGPINGFKRVNIAMNDGKYIISYLIGSNSYIELKDVILAGHSFFKFKDELKDSQYYSSYKECMVVIEKTKSDSFIINFEKNVDNSNNDLLCSIKNKKLSK